MDRLKVGILFGGCSEEHPISVKSAQEVATHLDIAKYEPFYIGITKSGAWKLCDGPDADWENGTARPAVLSPDRSMPGLLVLDQGRYETVSLDLVLPVLHGKFGEDGAIQGLLELSGIPYAGCDVQSSALCMDKSLAYIVARSAGIATPNFWTVTSEEDIDADQIALSDGFFRIHQEREPERGSDNATVIVPANISADSRSLVQETAKAIYRALGCSGLSRVDMFLTEDRQVVLNEVNTLPGMTSYSRYPRMMAAAGLPFADVIDRIVSLTLTETRR